MKKGFTLIELLAVIVILAIIALIATPIVLNIIDDAKESSHKRSIENYLKAVENTIADSQLKEDKIVNGIYFIDKDGNLCSGNVTNETCDVSTYKLFIVDVSGYKPSSGKIGIQDGKLSNIVLDNEVINNSNKEIQVVEASPESWFEYSITNNEVTITGLKEEHKNEKEIAIPERIGGKLVTSIGEYAFEDYDKLTSVVIPNSVTSIEVGAFRDCTSLTNVTIPEGITIISANVFRNCTSLTSIIIPNGVTTIKDHAFVNCSSLTSVVIPGSVTNIYNDAFNQCKNLTSITIPDGVTKIEGYAFAECNKLVSVTLPSSIETIGSNVFNFSPLLNSINYAGTMDDWENIEKLDSGNSHWYLGSSEIQVSCSDGTIGDVPSSGEIFVETP